MLYVLASSSLATWGQIAAIILAIELFFFILIALVLNLGGLFLAAWIREKINLIKKVRPVVDTINTKTDAALKGTLPAPSSEENKIVRTIAQIPAQVKMVDQKVEQNSDRVANAVIEFRARTVMVQGVVKAFFLPGLTRRKLPPPEARTMLPEQRSSSPELRVQGRAAELPATGNERSNQPVAASQSKDASIY